MVRICHVIPFYNEQYGGSERYVQLLSTHQIKDGFDVTIITTTRSKAKIGIIPSQDGIKIIKCYSITDIWNINPVSLVLHRLKKEKIDILHVHSYLYFTSNQAAFFGKIRRIPVLLHLHGGVGQPPYKASILKRTAKSFYDKTLGSQTFSFSDMIASVSKRDIEVLSNHKIFNKHQIEYIPNAVNVEFFEKKEKSRNPSTIDFKILYIGDIEPWKGMGLIERWIKSRKIDNDKNIIINFIGKGSYVPRLLSLRQQNLSSNLKINYLGQVSHKKIPKYLRESDVLLLPSYWEGIPTVILEAMASRTPVIATSVGDIPNIIKNGKNGFLIKHDLKSLKRTIDNLIEEPNLLEEIGKEAHKTVTNSFTGEKIHKMVKRAYYQLMNFYNG